MLEKKNILLEDYHPWYGEGTNVPLKKVKKAVKMIIFDHTKMQKTILRLY